MNRTRIWWLVLVAMTPAVAAADVDSATVERLCRHVQARKTLHVDRSQSPVIWSDGAMFEIAPNFPPGLEALLASPTTTRDMRALVERFTQDAGRPEWRDARLVRRGSGADHAVVETTDGKLTLQLASPYAAYVTARHPRARIRVKDALSPILFLNDDALCAAVMPIAQPRVSADRPAPPDD